MGEEEAHVLQRGQMLHQGVDDGLHHWSLDHVVIERAQFQLQLGAQLLPSVGLVQHLEAATHTLPRGLLQPLRHQPLLWSSGEEWSRKVH